MNKKISIISAIAIAVLVILTAIFCKCTITVADEKEETHSKEELISIIEECELIKEHAHTMAESARALGWSNEDELIKAAQSKWIEADKKHIKYKEQLDQIIKEEENARKKAEEEAAIAQKAKEEQWAVKSAEYPAATQIWRYMKSQGWNDYVCAGIMGNLMAEVGGGTLDIRYALSSYDGNYYGMCQWSRGYSQIWGAGLETQCDFLRDTIKYEFDTYGGNYQYGFNFNSFLNMKDASQAALAFAKAYERCAAFTYEVRQSNAIKAYNYFVN